MYCGQIPCSTVDKILVCGAAEQLRSRLSGQDRAGAAVWPRPADRSGRLPGPLERGDVDHQRRAGSRSDRLGTLNGFRRPAAGRWYRSAPGPWSVCRMSEILRSSQSGQDHAGELLHRADGPAAVRRLIQAALRFFSAA